MHNMAYWTSWNCYIFNLLSFLEFLADCIENWQGCCTCICYHSYQRSAKLIFSNISKIRLEVAVLGAQKYKVRRNTIHNGTCRRRHQQGSRASVKQALMVSSTAEPSQDIHAEYFNQTKHVKCVSIARVDVDGVARALRSFASSWLPVGMVSSWFLVGVVVIDIEVNTSRHSIVT